VNTNYFFRITVFLLIFLALAGVFSCCSNTAGKISFAVAQNADFPAEPVFQNNSIWAGYLVASNTNKPEPTITSINASWTVPEITQFTSGASSAEWIGIGGFFDKTLIQVGSEQDSFRDHEEYSVWYELLPDNAITIESINVSPGDTIYASISLVNPAMDEWLIYIADSNGNQVFQKTVIYHASQLSAEWILERPEINGRVTSMANLTMVTFNDCQATISGKTNMLGSYPSFQLTMYESLNSTQGINQLTYISDILNGGYSFNVSTYKPENIPELSVLVIAPLLAATTLAAYTLKKRFAKAA
jgi:hypothetical protein